MAALYGFPFLAGYPSIVMTSPALIVVAFQPRAESAEGAAASKPQFVTVPCLDLLCGPLGGRMGRDVKMDDPSTVMRKDDEDEQDFEPNRMDREEVYRIKLKQVIVQERSPRL